MALMECTVFIGAIRAQRTTRHGNKLVFKKNKEYCRIAGDPHIFKVLGHPDQKHMVHEIFVFSQ